MTMTMTSIAKPLAGALGALALAASGAAAHHGWAWAEEEQMELAGTIAEIYVGPPHPSLQVEVDGEMWTVDLGNPRQTQASGFDENTAEAGDEIVALGNRSSDPDERRLKAVRITIDGQDYDLYPDRIQGT